MKRTAGDHDQLTAPKPKRPRRPAFQVTRRHALQTQSRTTTLRLHSSGRLTQRRKDNNVEVLSRQDDTLTPDASTSSNVDTNTNSETDVAETKAKARKRNTTTTKLSQWLLFRDTTLRELLRHEGLGDFMEKPLCFMCGVHPGTLRCRDCFSRGLGCNNCIVRAHSCLPLHRPEKWNGAHFEKTTLQALGLRVQLGHGGGACPMPEPGPADFMVVDINGFHRVSIDYCDCKLRGFLHRRTQILRAQWFPATFDRPKTAFTFAALDFFHELTLQGKTTLYDFYHTLLRITDNSKLQKTIYRYPELHRAVRIWRHLQMLKRAGRGHDPAGVAATGPGELAVECPACPHPGCNIPEGWESAPLGIRWLYVLFLAVDANFKLKLKHRGITDPEMAPGWAYFVHEDQYQAFLTNYNEQPEINTCQSEHDAISRANIRNTPGYSVSGTGLVICARHALVRKNGVGDLQKGERYCNMDFIILSTLIAIQILHVIISYDIACQWSKNLEARAADYPPALKTVVADVTWEAVIPRWHINGHGEGCKTEYSFNYTDGVRRTCGEDVESGWSHVNQLGTSTREMGPGARHETLNDHWGGWNWQKIVGFRLLFKKRFVEAILLHDKHRETVTKLTSTFSASKIQEWEEMITAWKNDRQKPRQQRTIPNPYKEPTKVTTVQDVRLELAREDAANAARGALPPHDVGPTEFLTIGLDLEEQQRVLRLEVARTKTRTPKQCADLQVKRNSLLCRIQRWREIQTVYMPGLASLIQSLPPTLHLDDPDHELFAVEDLPLWLPSSLTPVLRNTPPIHDLSVKECRLRMAQADDSLAQIRHHRRVLAGLYQFKRLNTSGTGNKPNTRMHTLFNRFNHRTLACAERYWAAYTILLKLDPQGSWHTRFQKLDPKDIRGPGKDDDEPNGRYVPSWIWLVPRVPSAPDLGDSEVHLDDSLRVEWVKSKARLTWWEEEVILVEEEMRRVVEYLKWKSEWWQSQRNRGVQADTAVLQGISAYAERQAALMMCLAISCAETWLPILHKCGITPAWGALYVMHAQGVSVADMDHTQATNSGWSDDEDDEVEEDEVIDDAIDVIPDSDEVAVDLFEMDD